MKVNFKKAIEVNKLFKEQFDIDDKEEVQEITAASSPTKKNNPVCVMYKTLALEKKVSSILDLKYLIR